MESDNTVNKKLNELFKFHEDMKLQYCGHCKLSINFLSKLLLIEPVNEDQKLISALFTWKFLQIKNILFCFAENSSQNFFLVFNNEKICKKVYTLIYHSRIRDRIYQKELDEDFFVPIFNQIAEIPKLKEIIVPWINIIDVTRRRKCLKNIKDRSLLDDLFPADQNMDLLNNADNSSTLKRKHSEIANINSKKEEIFDFEVIKKKMASTEFKKVINDEMFKIVTLKSSFCSRFTMIIFASESKTHCYEYSSKSNKFYYCRRCPSSRPTRAILCSEKDGKEFLHLEDNKHSCSPLLYVPEKYNEFKLLKKPDYEIVENCFIKTGKMLIIFNPENRNECYEYVLNKSRNLYCCCGCFAKGLPSITVELCHEGTENEYIRLCRTDHICQYRNYEPEKYQQSKKFILSPNFEVQISNKKSGIKKTLVIFGENDRNFCYKYYYNNNRGMFQCSKCSKKGKQVNAQPCQNSEGEEYVILSKAAHVCELQLYTPEKLLRPPEFTLMEQNNPNQPAKLFVFNSSTFKHGYIFSSRTKSENYFGCVGCQRKNWTSKKHNNGPKKVVTLNLCKDDDGKDFVQMKPNQKHICQPLKYNPKQFSTSIIKNRDDFIFFQTNAKNSKKLNLVLFDPNSRKLCYKFCYCESYKKFVCINCEKKRKTICAKIDVDSDGNEFVTTQLWKHICSPIKVSFLKEPGIKILEKSGLTFEKKIIKKREKEIDESKILKSERFELRRNKSGLENGTLIIFKENDNTLCYQYHFENSDKKYKCSKCKSQHKTVTATLHEDKGEKCLILGENEHVCEPVKYEAIESEVVNSDKFMVFDQTDNSKPAKLVLFTSSSKDFCYYYSYKKELKKFACSGCLTKRKTVTAKVITNKNGEECLLLCQTNHICQPKKFILKEYQPKILPESSFSIEANQYGKPNSKIILFDPEKDGFAFSYFEDRPPSFTCTKCKELGKLTRLELCENENGEKYVKLGPNPHICKSFKYEKLNELIKSSHFMVFDRNDETKKTKVILFLDDSKELCYQYSFIKNANLFKCSRCCTLGKAVSGKLIQDENGEECFQLFKKNAHVCTPKKFVLEEYSRKSIAESGFKLGVNNTGKPNSKIILFDPKKKGYGFIYSKTVGNFYCLKCYTMKKTVTLKLCEKESGEKFVELSNNPHVCKSERI